MTAANSIQIAGDHYQKPIQPWDFIVANELGYLEGNIVKYVSRWKDKGGVQDLLKAQHYLQKLIEVTNDRSKEQESPGAQAERAGTGPELYSYGKDFEVQGPRPCGCPAPSVRDDGTAKPGV